jgi:branched-chain amino acid transport system ATP-binding protein
VGLAGEGVMTVASSVSDNVALSVKNLSKDFSGLQVLTGVNLDVLEGERHAVIGPNGAGKTTFFNVVSGMYKPSNGTIQFHGKEIGGLPAHRVARLRLSRSFQITTIFGKMTVYENVRSAIVSKFNRRLNFVSILSRHKGIKQETDRIIDLVELGDVVNVPASELSYGRQRHLELALTVARDPLLVMLDEPTAGLNSEESRQAVKLIRQVTEGKTLMMVEHDMDVVFNLADRITVLANGSILATGHPDEIRENEEVKKAYLGRK